jgi:restriction system protein
MALARSYLVPIPGSAKKLIISLNVRAREERRRKAQPMLPLGHPKYDVNLSGEGDRLAIPDFQTLMLPVLRVAATGEIRISDAVESLAVESGLSAEDRSQLLPSGRQTTFANRVHWAKSYLGKAGLVELTKRGHFRITDQGREVLATPPERIDIKYLNRFPGFQQFRGASEDRESGDSAPAASPGAGMGQALTPDEVMRSANRQMEVALADELMQRIRSGTPEFFESLVVRLLVGIGYGGSVVDVSKALVGGSGDGGIDGIIDQDHLGLDRIYVQAKRNAEGNTVGSGAIRDFFGGLDRYKVQGDQRAIRHCLNTCFYGC